VARSVLVAALLAAAAPQALARPPDARAPRAPDPAQASRDYARGGEIARELATLTGVSLSPLLGMSVLGAVEWWRTPPARRGELRWYAHPELWGAGLVLVALLFLGDKVPLARQVVKAVRLVESKVVAILAMPVLAELFASAVSERVGAAFAGAGALLVPAAQAASDASAATAADGVAPTPWHGWRGSSWRSPSGSPDTP
jgi:hypothetical protein